MKTLRFDLLFYEPIEAPAEAAKEGRHDDHHTQEDEALKLDTKHSFEYAFLGKTKCFSDLMSIIEYASESILAVSPTSSAS